ncbi:tyrosine--tRNA ligase [Thermoleophilia bacterium SCSIO 60948]|nr:tyrosine--tRNA ligase [Thermoleophilia bacterium SCSIO 60948]
MLRGASDVLPSGRLVEQLSAGRALRVKFGVDPTSPDIHLGHTVVLNRLRMFQELGHTVVLIIGDQTARVGDPSGRSELRPQLEPAEIEANTLTYTDQAFRVLDRDRTELRYNSEWLAMGSEGFIDLMRRFTVARLLERDDFARRIERAEPISMLELLYPIMQGYDSVAVRSDVELGGSDQKFNLLFGRTVQESFGMPPQSIMTLPILPGTDGVRKMSKSYGNYVGVTDPPGEIFGRLMSIPDEVMGTYYELLLGEALDPGAHPAVAKRALARRITDRFAGPGEGERAEATFDRVHRDGAVPDDVETFPIGPRDGEVHLPAVLAAAFGLSRSEARRGLGSGAVRLDGEPLDGGRLDVPAGELDGRVIRFGKRRQARLEAH